MKKNDLTNKIDEEIIEPVKKIDKKRDHNKIKNIVTIVSATVWIIIWWYGVYSIDNYIKYINSEITLSNWERERIEMSEEIDMSEIDYIYNVNKNNITLEEIAKEKGISLPLLMDFTWYKAKDKFKIWNQVYIPLVDNKSTSTQIILDEKVKESSFDFPLSEYKGIWDPFWRREHPILKDKKWKPRVIFHKWIDIKVKEYTDFFAVDDWVVVSAGWQWWYWKLVIIEHKNWLTTRYAHNSKLEVKKWQLVK